MGGTYEDLKAWQTAMDFAVDVYRATETFPKAEMYGLVSQLRRAAISIASNIAEGKGRLSDKELVYFLSNARGSVYESQTQIVLAYRLNLLTSREIERLSTEAAEVGRLLNGLIRALREPSQGNRRAVSKEQQVPKA